MTSLRGLDLAAEPCDLLQAAEVALLVAQQTRGQPETKHPASLSWLRNEPRPYAAEAWVDCVRDRAERLALRCEARALVALPGGAWTHWITADSAPRCGLEALAVSVLRFHLARLDTASAAGAEWWVQVRAPDESMPVHWDCDEGLKHERDVHIPPFLATVTYLGSVGAPTIVLPVKTDVRGHGVVEPNYSSSECSRCSNGSGQGAFASFPIAGKHLSFDGRLLHGTQYDGRPWLPSRLNACADALDRLDDAKPRTPQRITVLVNIWIGHRPTGVAALAEESVRALLRSGSWAARQAGGGASDATTAPGRRLMALARDALAAAKPVAVCLADRCVDDEVRDFRVGKFHEHLPIGVRRLGRHLRRPPSLSAHFVRVAHATAQLASPTGYCSTCALAVS